MKPTATSEMAAHSSGAVRLLQKLSDKTAHIGIVGLGYVGLPLAVEFAKAGFSTTGIDLNSTRINRLKQGDNYIQDVADADLESVVASGSFRATTTFECASELDVVFICVPTPVRSHKDPDTSFIRSAAKSLAPHLHAGQLVILKSTTWPGTTEELVGPVLAKVGGEKGLNLGEHYFLAYSPERIDPGNKAFTTANTPVVVGGVSETCTHVASKVLEQIVTTVHRVSSPRVAEMEKLLENIFRSVNIALANELARLCDRVGGISAWEVVEAAATKPFGYMPFYPGPGLGGHCIPIDPYYLSWLARRYDFETNFITLSARVNEEMPHYVVEAVLRAIAEQPIRLSQARVLVLGAAFKKDVDDTRHSPAEKLIELLLREGVSSVDISDPHVPSFSVSTLDGEINLESISLTAETVRSYDVLILATDHSDFPYQMLADEAGWIIDTRNAFSQVKNPRAEIMLLGGGKF